MCTGTRHFSFCLWLNCSLQCVIRERFCFILFFLQFPRIQMANCTRPPALNDKWQKKHISSIAQLTSRLHTDIPAESVVKSTVGCMDAGWHWKGFDIELSCSTAVLLRRYFCLWCAQVEVQVPKPTSWSDKTLSSKISRFCDLVIVSW